MSSGERELVENTERKVGENQIETQEPLSRKRGNKCEQNGGRTAVEGKNKRADKERSKGNTTQTGKRTAIFEKKFVGGVSFR